MTDNNVVQLGNKQQQLIGDDGQKALQNARLVLDSVMKQRKNGLEGLEKRVNNLLDSGDITADKMTPATVATLRDVVQALNSAYATLEANEKLLDMVINDLGGVSEMIEMHYKNWLNTSIHMQILLTILTEKNILSKEEIQETWVKLRKDHQE